MPTFAYMHRIIVLALWLSAFGLAAPVCAEPQDSDALRQAANADRRRLVADNLPLGAAEALAFWPLYERFERDLSGLARRRQSLINTFGENYDDMSDAMAKQIALEQLDYQEARLKLMKAYWPKFEKVLPAKKLARFYQIEGRIRAAIDAEIAERIPLIK